MEAQGLRRRLVLRLRRGRRAGREDEPRLAIGGASAGWTGAAVGAQGLRDLLGGRRRCLLLLLLDSISGGGG
uniref:Uncharacterized protein n=1 Tax=Arundo donax TaxID=35708 RepID=A0A0A9DKH5_ARUDO